VLPTRNPSACHTSKLAESSPPVDNLYLVKLDEIPDLLRWVELSERASYMSQEQAGEWRLKVVAWKGWRELDVVGAQH